MQERPGDLAEVEWLLDLAFAPGRTALSSYQLRAGVEPIAELCIVARDEYDVLAGCIRYWPVRIGAQGDCALLLGPVAVHPTRQGEGLGGVLIRDSLDRARAMAWSRVLLVGDRPYYGRFGFERLEGVIMPPPTNPDRVLGVELEPGAWRGIRGQVERSEPGDGQ